MTAIRFGRAVELITSKAGVERAGKQIGLEAIESGTGRLLPVDVEYSGGGVGFEAGDVLFGKLRPYLAKSWLADEGGSAVGDFHVYRPVAGVSDARYINYVTLSHAFLDPVVSSVFGAKMPRASWDFVRTVEINLPSTDEQRAIADYLDRETAQIDTLIAKQEQLITTLRERRTGIADQVVGTRVGVGERLKWSLVERDERAGERASLLPLLSVSISWGVQRRDESVRVESRAEDLSTYKVARTGDIVINRMRAFQGALGRTSEDGLVSPDYSVLCAHDDIIDSEWLSMLMRTPAFVSEMSARLKGIGTTDSGVVRTPRINVADLLDIKVDVPVSGAQRVELRAIEDAVERVDTLIAKAERFIELAKERRAALITAAVTGQLKIPSAS